ncbi:serine hydrolase [Dyadobacter aurulentus]|uniref:serine hydrolase n=1 Tax=Dyadobacter sp. UC 10 TaxID=2605428 RepID=UPI0011F253E7|nr:serine hydrolase [Dyadobacter sp. UC 10]KAA0993349.1 serine hydrolase [Dyadobacter sp. UC 10]
MRILFVLLSVLVVSKLCAQTSKLTVSEKIRLVESSLLPAIVMEGETIPYMSITDRMKQLDVSGLGLAIIKDGRIEWAKSYGIADRQSGRAVNEHTLFQAASVSKPVTALAVLHWVEKGKFELDTDINHYLKNWKVPENEFTKTEKVTLRRLLSHEAGITVHGFRGYSVSDSVPTLSQVLRGEKPANSRPIVPDTIPGSIFRYSGGGYTIIQQALTDQLGKAFPDIMQETVFDRIGMKNSTFGQPVPAKFRSNAATGYRANGKEIDGNWHTYPELAAAGLWTTPTDLARYVIEIQQSLKGKSNRIISRETASTMVTNPSHPYGLGPMLISQDDSLVFIHGGSNEGFRCIYIAEATTGNGAVIMTNSDNDFTLIYDIVRSIAKVYNWFFYKSGKISRFDLNNDQLARLTGTYNMPGYTFELVQNNGLLHLKPHWEKPVMELLPKSLTQFTDRDGRYDVEFVYDNSGKVKAAKVFGDTFEKTDQ